MARLEPAGDQILRLLAAQEFLRGRSDDALLAERLAPAAELAVDIRLAPRRRARLSLDRGLALRADVDEATVGLLAELGGGNILADALERADLERDEALSAIRRLVELGFIVPALEFSGSIKSETLDPRSTHFGRLTWSTGVFRIQKWLWTYPMCSIARRSRTQKTAR